MTSDEIERRPLMLREDPLNGNLEMVARWLKEIAYQLAVMNEARTVKEPESTRCPIVNHGQQCVRPVTHPGDCKFYV